MILIAIVLLLSPFTLAYPNWVKESLCEKSKNGIQQIPKIIHQIWFDFGSGKEVKEKYRKYSNGWKELHPTWDYKLWEESQVTDLISLHFPEYLMTYLNYDVDITRHDAARLVILAVHGGVYLDHDIMPLKNLEPLFGKCSFVVLAEGEEYCINNAFIGTTPRNPFLLHLIKQLPKTAGHHVIGATGPAFISSQLEQNLNMLTSLNLPYRIYPKTFGFESFHKFSGTDPTKELVLRECPKAWMLQLFDGTWKGETEEKLWGNKARND